MNPWRWVDPRIQSVRLADVQSYFLRQGWKLKPNPNTNLLRFEKPADGGSQPLFQMIPATEHFADYRQRLVELVTTLSELEDRHPIAVLNDILSQACRTPLENGPARAADEERART
jgi:hypothetical protein